MATKASNEPETVLRGHTCDITAAAFAWNDPTGFPMLLSGASDGQVRLWSLQTRRPVTTLAAHGGACLAVRALAGNRLLTQGRDGAVRLWDASEGLRTTPLLELPSECYNFCQCACSEALLHSEQAFTDKSYYVGSGDEHGEAVDEDGAAAEPATAEDCRSQPGVAAPLLAMPSEDAQELRVWDLRQRSAARRLLPSEAHGRAGMCMCARFVGPGDGLLLSGWEDGSLQAFDLRGTAGAATARKLHSEPLLCLDVDAAGSIALSGSADCKLCVTPLVGGAPTEPSGIIEIPVTNAASGSGGLASLCSRADGRVFAAGGWDRRVRIWQWKRLKPLAVLQQHTGTVNVVCFSSCSRWLASASSDATIALWTLFPPKEQKGNKEPTT